MSPAEQREEALFEAALQFPADQRATYLDKACAGDADLRRRMEALLGAFERAGGFMNQPVTPERTVRFSPLPIEKPGDRIGRYKLLEQIGEGGCGVVYVAEQEKPVRRRVALKVTKVGMDTKQVIARFDAERQALAMMDHPNIAKVLDAGATEAGRPYFVMELVRGIKMTDYCDQHDLPPRARLDLFIQVCRAIQHAHQKGVIHRDIKPSNILVTLHDGVPVPKVIDFGIAKATQGRLTDQTVYTAFEQFIGTPAYMSPEQAELSGLDIDTRSDIYSLGVLLYELLTGKTPFDAKELLAAGLDEMRRTIREVEPVKPSTRLTQERTGTAESRKQKTESTSAIRNRQSAIPSDLDWIVMKCLEKDRARRYETANGLATDISRHLNNEPVIARPPSRFYRFQKSVQRNKLAFGAATSVALALVVGLTVSTVMFFKVRAEKKKAQTEATKSQQVAQFLKDMLEGVGPSVAMGRDTTMLREILEKTAERADQALKDGPEVEAELRATMGLLYEQLSQFAKAEAMHRRALALRRTLFGNRHLDVAGSLDGLAGALFRSGQLAEAETSVREALAVRTRALGRQHPLVANSLHLLFYILKEKGKVVEAEAAQREALAIRKKLFGDDHLQVANSLNDLGRILSDQGKLTEAEILGRQALAIYRKLCRKEDLELAWGLDNLGLTLRNQRKLEEAEAVNREALSIRRKLLGNEHVYVAFSLHHLGLVVHERGKLAEAEPLVREALTIQRKIFGNNIPDVPWLLEELAGVLRDQGKFSEAESVLREALAIQRTSSGNNSKDVPRLLRVLGFALWDQNQLADAEAILREGLAIQSTNFGTASAEATELVKSLAACLAAQRRFSDGAALLTEELERLRARLPESDAQIDYIRVALIETLVRGERFTDAEPLARESLALAESKAVGHWTLFDAQVWVGASLLGQKRFAEAEPLLLSGYEGLKEREASIPRHHKWRLREGLWRLAALYQATDRPSQATEATRKLAELEKVTK